MSNINKDFIVKQLFERGFKQQEINNNKALIVAVIDEMTLILAAKKPRSRLESIIDIINEKLGVDLTTEFGRDRKTSDARLIFYSVSRKNGYTCKKIGAIVNRKPSSVWLGIRKFNEIVRFDKKLASDYHNVVSGLENWEKLGNF